MLGGSPTKLGMIFISRALTGSDFGGCAEVLNMHLNRPPVDETLPSGDSKYDYSSDISHSLSTKVESELFVSLCVRRNQQPPKIACLKTGTDPVSSPGPRRKI